MTLTLRFKFSFVRVGPHCHKVGHRGVVSTIFALYVTGARFTIHCDELGLLRGHFEHVNSGRNTLKVQVQFTRFLYKILGTRSPYTIFQGVHFQRDRRVTMGAIGSTYSVTHSFRVLLLVYTGKRGVNLVGRGVYHRGTEVDGRAHVSVITILDKFVFGLDRSQGLARLDMTVGGPTRLTIDQRLELGGRGTFFKVRTRYGRGNGRFHNLLSRLLQVLPCNSKIGVHGAMGHIGLVLGLEPTFWHARVVSRDQGEY